MIAFTTKNCIEIDKDTLYLGNEEKLCKQIEAFFFENQCEMVLIYENHKYQGYIDRDNMFDIVIPEFYLGFIPVELEASAELMDKIKEYRNKNVKKEMIIPIKNTETSAMRDFAIDVHDDSALFDLEVLEDFVQYIKSDNSCFMPEANFDNEVVVLPELDEVTYNFYRILLVQKRKVIVNGKFWKYIQVNNEKSGGMDTSEVVEYNYSAMADTLEKGVKKSISEVIRNMQRRGINAYNIILPVYDELAEHGALEDKIRNGPMEVGSLRKKDFPDRQYWIDILMETECCETEEELLYSEHPDQYGREADKTIYLAGPCIVAGSTTAETASLAFILHSKLAALDMDYNIKRISKSKYDISLAEELEALDIRNNDFVFFISDSEMYQVEEDDVDLLEEYNNRPIDGWWFLDKPIHTFRRANEMIGDRLCSLIAEKYEGRKAENKLIQVGRPYLSGKQIIELQKYIATVKIDKKYGSKIGCIVINANPFTKGHLYLTENAAADVDQLLLFVVEEDLSEFSFSDRIQMVRRGVKHLKNVVVIPSGSFILSKRTFVSYFEKDERQAEKVDSSLDINFFGAYIAPAFGIRKRFVGEEPKDMVTRQYNEKMKKRLPMYGVEVEEIPRKEVNGDVISASTVRRLYLAKEWETIRAYLPDTTIQYLKNHDVVMRDKEWRREQMAKPIYIMNSLKERIAKCNKIIFYGVGVDGRGLYHLLDSEEKKKVILCDGRAEIEEYHMEGKRVYAPITLLKEFASYPIIITSTQFGKQIRSDLSAIGICFSRLVQNTYSFWGKN